jgi:hypothetical protein
MGIRADRIYRDGITAADFQALIQSSHAGGTGSSDDTPSELPDTPAADFDFECKKIDPHS